MGHIAKLNFYDNPLTFILFRQTGLIFYIISHNV